MDKVNTYRYIAIICEFNPLHNGHKYLLDVARATFPDHKIVAIMSGQFTQRGDIALLNKYERATHAIYSGADIVVELPTAYALSSAENFALGGVKVANSIKGMEYLMFASESGEITELDAIADIISCNTKNLGALIKAKSKEGVTYARATAESIVELSKTTLAKLDSSKIEELLNTPNNMLAIEYLTALKATKSKIKPFTVKRIGEGYNSLVVDGDISSASGIRNVLRSNAGDILETLRRNVPPYVAETIICKYNNMDCDNNKQPICNLVKDNCNTTTEIVKLKTRPSTFANDHCNTNTEILQKQLSKFVNDNCNTKHTEIVNGTFNGKLCFMPDLTEVIFGAILTKTKVELSNIYGITEGLENRILSSAKNSHTLDGLLDGIKTKRYTTGRIARALFFIMLGVTKSDYKKMTATVPYSNILSIKKDSLGCLANFKSPILTKYNDRKGLKPRHAELIALDDKANSLYCYFSKQLTQHHFIII